MAAQPAQLRPTVAAQPAQLRPAVAAQSGQLSPRPRGRVAGRHEARWHRGLAERRYLLTILAADLAVGLAVAAVAYRLPPRELAALPGWAHFSLPGLLVVALGLAGAYERRFLFVGAEEFRRVVRAGLSLMATAVIVSVAGQVPLARSYVLVALPAATLAIVVLRAVLRRRLRRAVARHPAAPLPAARSSLPRSPADRGPVGVVWSAGPPVTPDPTR